jgi:hypothetical protein
VRAAPLNLQILAVADDAEIALQVGDGVRKGGRVQQNKSQQTTFSQSVGGAQPKPIAHVIQSRRGLRSIRARTAA